MQINDNNIDILSEKIDSDSLDIEKFAIWGNIFEALVKAAKDGKMAEKFDELKQKLSGESEKALEYFFEFIQEHTDELIESNVNEYENNDSFNPKIFSGEEVKDKVVKVLNNIANLFISSWDIDLDVEDVVLTGSNVNYNWDENSDLDLHVLVDMSRLSEKPKKLVKSYFSTLAKKFNDTFDFSLAGHPIEVYVQEHDEPHHSTGVYSTQDNKWLQKPDQKHVEVEDSKIKTKAEPFIKLIDNISSIAEVEKVKELLKKFRKTGLSREGEYSVENLAFKFLRRAGYLKKLALKQVELTKKDVLEV